ncbi:MAG: BMP family ABC transporter substrate-binding protein [Spirochaetia bacterium]|nr:BMP family ABC transporter substrate-binding protein [Spirochaetia bacterium]
MARKKLIIVLGVFMVNLKSKVIIVVVLSVFISCTIFADDMFELSTGKKIIIRDNGSWLFERETSFDNIQIKENSSKLLIIKSNEDESSELIIEVINNDLSNSNVFIRLQNSLDLANKTNTVQVEYGSHNERIKTRWKLINDYLIKYSDNPFYFYNAITESNNLVIKIYNETNYYRQSQYNIEGLSKILQNYKSYENVSSYTPEVYNKSKFISMATDVGGLGDKSYNDGAYQGLLMAEEKLEEIRIKVIESMQQTDYIPNLTGLAEDGSDIVFAVGFLMESAVKEVASNMPYTYFAGIDIGAGENDPKNFQGMLYKEEQAGYLAGVVAGMMTKKHADKTDKINDENVVGVVLGMLIPPVENYEVGFIQGVHSVNPDCKVLSKTAGTFVDREKGKEAALAMIDKGADIIFHIAGLSGLGAIQAAKEEGVLAIGVDVDQNNVAPDTVLTSAEKKISQSVYLLVQSVVNSNFEGGTKVYGLQQDAVGISPFHNFDDMVPNDVRDAVQKAKEKIINGEIIVRRTREAIGR